MRLCLFDNRYVHVYSVVIDVSVFPIYVRVCEQYGQTALDRAKQHGHDDMARLIEVRFA